MAHVADRVDANDRFDPAAVTAVCRHLNDDHRADLLALAQVLGGARDATAATATSVDAQGLVVEVIEDPETSRSVRVDFPAPVHERAGLREVLTELTLQVREGRQAAPDDAGFAAALREATAQDHSRSEEAPFLEGLLGGDLGIAAFHALALQHREIYEALERGTEQLVKDPVVAPFLAPELARRDALEADLQWLVTADPGPRPPVLPATQRYTDRIREVATTWPAGFVAHHYTRYLGDLSGGLHIGRVLDRRFAGGTGFYRFEHITDVRGFKQRYRRHLDAAPWDAAERRRFIDEVGHAYELNRQVFAALGEYTAEVAGRSHLDAEVGA